MTKTDPIEQAIALTEETLLGTEKIMSELRMNRDQLKKAQQALRRAARLKQRQGKKARGSRSGFAAPVRISEEMCAFLKLEPGSLVPRTEVTKQVNAYIKKHELQSPADKRIIIPDACLERLVGVQAKPLTFFTLQGALNPHFSS